MGIVQALKNLFWDSDYDVDVYDRVKFVEAYKSYMPPFSLVPELRPSLRVVPPKFLRGLNRIVLTNTAALSRRRRRERTYSRKRAVRISDVRGLYHPAWNGEEPHIELFVDKLVVKSGSRYYKRHISILSLSSVLFHEIGHHIHYTKHPEQGEWERIAEKHQKRFNKRLLLRQSFRHPVALASLISDVGLIARTWNARHELRESFRLYRKLREKKRLAKKKRK
ncbi:MAG: hypothetical protein IT366_07085 [Candidatus Hydrogenedentes bacterium]|nr:hypothetical protein [Candidatus Hydrogenedentota bacterium]